MATVGTFTILDYSGETARTTISYDQTQVQGLGNLPGFLSEWGALRGAIEGIIDGVVQQESAYVFNSRLSNILPPDATAQVERVWIVTYEDDTAFFGPLSTFPNQGYRKLFQITIPTAEVTGRLLPNSDEADLTNAQIAAFVTAFEQIARSPYGGAVRVLKITHSGSRR
jgi:hypothetical protein